MGKYFGTDGVRGVANGFLTPELAFRIGRCGGYVLTKKASRPKVIIGRDPRISGEMLESSLVAGLLSIGVDVVRLGVISTPGVAYLTQKMTADAGIMISASHNPAEDNGIKFFGGDGFKISDETELEIERLLDTDIDELPRPTGEKIGVVVDDLQAKFEYLNFIKQSIDVSFSGVKIVLDCANGAAYELAPRLYKELGAEVITIFNEPDGMNINNKCGSTHPEALQVAVLEHQAQLGLSFDGDADRLIAVDEKGEILDGDQILTVCGLYLHEQGKLKKETIVSTVMSNLGFVKTLEASGLNVVQSGVGDRYVMQAMREGGYNFGGEQSGHIIFLDYSSTGDGILAGLQVVQTMICSKQPLSKLKQKMKTYPQVLKNVVVGDKSKLEGNHAISEKIDSIEQKLSGSGRVLVRASGTEPMIRVMAEGPDADEIEQYVTEIASVIKEQLG